MSHLYQLLQKSAPDSLFYFFLSLTLFKSALSLFCVCPKSRPSNNARDALFPLIELSWAIWLHAKTHKLLRTNSQILSASASKNKQKKKINKACRYECQLFLRSIQTLDIFIHSAFKKYWNCEVKEHQLKDYYQFACWLWLYLCHVSATYSRLSVS